MSFRSMSFRSNVDEEKKIESWAGPLSAWSLRVLPVVVWVFSGDSAPHRCACWVNWHV